MVGVAGTSQAGNTLEQQAKARLPCAGRAFQVVGGWGWRRGTEHSHHRNGINATQPPTAPSTPTACWEFQKGSSS